GREGNVQPEPREEDEEQREDQFEEQGRPVQVRAEISVDEPEVDVHAARPPDTGPAPWFSVTRLMNASSRVVFEMSMDDTVRPGVSVCRLIYGRSAEAATELY